MNSKTSLPSEPQVRCIRLFSIKGVIMHLTGQAMMGIGAVLAFKAHSQVIGSVMLVVCATMNAIYCFWKRK